MHYLLRANSMNWNDCIHQAATTVAAAAASMNLTVQCDQYVDWRHATLHYAWDDQTPAP